MPWSSCAARKLHCARPRRVDLQFRIGAVQVFGTVCKGTCLNRGPRSRFGSRDGPNLEGAEASIDDWDMVGSRPDWVGSDPKRRLGDKRATKPPRSVPSAMSSHVHEAQREELGRPGREQRHTAWFRNTAVSSVAQDADNLRRGQTTRVLVVETAGPSAARSRLAADSAARLAST